MTVSIDDEIFLNQAAQGIISASESEKWFDTWDLDKRRALIRRLGFFALQAGARDSDMPDVVTRSGLRTGYTPVVLMTKGPIRAQVSKLPTLPPDDLRKSFLLLLSLFGIADDRKRQRKCSSGCSHWWHRDLRDSSIVSQIRQQEDGDEK